MQRGRSGWRAAGEVLNQFLVEVFGQILKAEAACLAGKDLSLRELHLIDAVCLGGGSGRGQPLHRHCRRPGDHSGHPDLRSKPAGEKGVPAPPPG